MSSVASSSSTSALASLSQACQVAEVDAELLHHTIEKQADDCYATARRLVHYTRWMGTLCLASALVACAPLYYLNAQVYRVWRLRQPESVRRYQLACVGGGGLALTSFLFLISPVGFLHAHDRRWQQGHELDALAVQALTLRGDYRTLQFWAAALLEAQKSARDARGTSSELNTEATRDTGSPWVRITHLVPPHSPADPPTSSATTPSISPEPIKSKQEELAAALLKDTDVGVDTAPSSVPLLVPHTWTLADLEKGKKKWGASWLEGELWAIMDACVSANEKLILARDETLQRSL